jgi:predicted DNA-binding protein
MIAVAMATPPFLLDPATNEPYRPAIPLAKRAVDGDLVQGVLENGELLLVELRERYERTALRWVQRFIDERLPPLTEVSLAASALAELRHGHRDIGLQTLKQLLRRGQAVSLSEK